MKKSTLGRVRADRPQGRIEFGANPARQPLALLHPIQRFGDAPHFLAEAVGRQIVGHDPDRHARRPAWSHRNGRRSRPGTPRYIAWCAVPEPR